MMIDKATLLTARVAELAFTMQSSRKYPITLLSREFIAQAFNFPWMS